MPLTRVFSLNCSIRVVVEGMPAIKAFLSNMYIAIFTFLIAKTAMQRQQLCQTDCSNYFYFFPYKNCYAKAAVPATDISIAELFYPIYP